MYCKNVNQDYILKLKKVGTKNYGISKIFRVYLVMNITVCNCYVTVFMYKL